MFVQRREAVWISVTFFLLAVEAAQKKKKINRESIEACCFLKSNGRRNEKGQSQKFSQNIKFTVFNALEEENATVH